MGIAKRRPVPVDVYLLRDPPLLKTRRTRLSDAVRDANSGTKSSSDLGLQPRVTRLFLSFFVFVATCRVSCSIPSCFDSCRAKRTRGVHGGVGADRKIRLSSGDSR